MLCTTFPCSLHLPTRKVRSHSGLETAQAVRGGAQAGSSCPTQDLQIQMDKDARQHEELREQYNLQERRLSLLQTELEDVRSALEGSERSRKLLEQEVVEVTERTTSSTSRYRGSSWLSRVDSHSGCWGGAGAVPKPRGLPSILRGGWCPLSADPQDSPRASSVFPLGLMWDLSSQTKD